MVSKLQYTHDDKVFKQDLALHNLRWYLHQADLIKAEELGSHTHTISNAIDSDSDNYAEQLIKRLEESPSHFLGSYVEQLWRHYIESSPRYQLLAHNLQVHDNGKTLGEFDFIVSDNISGEIIHQEIAAKFYLGLPKPDQTGCLWFGPNNIDRLDIKVAHLTHKQLNLSGLQAAKNELKKRDIHKVTTQCILRGRLFLPWNPKLNTQCKKLDKLAQHNYDNLWMTLTEFKDYNSTNQVNVRFWLLEKQQWLSLFTRNDTSIGYEDLIAKLEQLVINEHRGVMVKIKTEKGTASLNTETALFIVPDDWQHSRYDSLGTSLEKPRQP